MENQKPDIVVVGAGVVGLQTALQLLEQGLQVTILSRDWPGDESPLYTSMWAGAQWRSTSEMDNTRQQDWARQTFTHWTNLSKQLPVERTGVMIKPARYLWHSGAPDKSPGKGIWWTYLTPFYKVIFKPLLPSTDQDTAGISFQSFSISPPRHLKYLLSTNLERGAKCIAREIASHAEVFSMPGHENLHGVVNCTGIGAAKLVCDQSLFPTKGQSVMVRGEARRVTSMVGDGWEAVVVPRCGEGNTFLGVSKVAGDWSLEPDEEVTQAILNRCRPLAPELLSADGEFDVLSVQVGLRPSRNGGPRVELEVLDPVGRRPKYLYHNYGHSGAGFEESFGSARTVAQMVMSRVKL